MLHYTRLTFNCTADTNRCCVGLYERKIKTKKKLMKEFNLPTTCCDADEETLSTDLGQEVEFVHPLEFPS